MLAIPRQQVVHAVNGRDPHVKCIDAGLGRKAAACDKSLCLGCQMLDTTRLSR
jgi:hypothetical protein